MSIVRVQAVLDRVTALPQDAVVNTWHFLTTTSPPSNDTREAIFTALVNFYGAIDGPVLSTLLANTARLKMYDIADPKPRAVIDERDFTLTTTTGALPAEVAVVMSFQATKASGENQRRRRGRVFLGPINTGVVATLTGRTAVVLTARNAIVSAGLGLLTASNAAADWEWAVYSPTDGAAVAVNNGWCDDAFDTIRSRGEKPQTRSVFVTV